jgi:phage gp29-like protein
LLEALIALSTDAVAAIPEGAKVAIQAVADKAGASKVHADFIEACNAEISKAILGQTLTTELGKVGSFAAARTHNLIREDLATSDRRRVAGAFNRLAAVWTLYNYGAEVVPPKFEFVKDEDLQRERADRDAKLYAAGWRPKASYIAREYGIPEEDFELAGTTAGEVETFARQAEGNTACACGCRATNTRRKPAKASVFRRILARWKTLFYTKEEKRALRDRGLMEEFMEGVLRDSQRQVDAMIDRYVDALGAAETYEDARTVLGAAYGAVSFEEFARLLDEARFAASGLGYAGGADG